jgi:hypothetical protein
MIWLTWRQVRLNVAVVYAGLLALVVALVLTGPHLADVYAEDAKTFLDWISLRSSEQTLYTLGMAAGYVVPAVVGAFWGAPLVARELEAGTHRLVWTQSITRSQWLATKLGLGMLGAIAAGAVIGLGMTWWAHPIDRAVNLSASDDISSFFQIPRIAPEIFASRGIAPIGYAALAFALGVVAGALVKRTVPAMAITLAAYVILQIVMPMWVRPHLVAPTEQLTAITSETLHGIRGRGPNGPVDALDVGGQVPGGWVLANRTVDADGNSVHKFPDWVMTCLPTPGTKEVKFGAREQACFDRLADQGYRQQVTSQPPSHYWALQWRETGLLLGGAALLVGACFWRVRRLS